MKEYLVLRVITKMLIPFILLFAAGFVCAAALPLFEQVGRSASEQAV